MGARISLRAAWFLPLALGAALTACGGRHERGREAPEGTTSGGAAVAGAPASGTGTVGGSAGSGASNGGDSNNGGSSIGGNSFGGAGSLGGGTQDPSDPPEVIETGDGGDGGADAGAPSANTPLSFAAPVFYRGGSWAMDIGVADLDGDGALDVAAADFSSPTGGAFVWLNKGDGTFDAASSYLPGKHGTSIAIGDFNGDAKPELAVASEEDVTLLTNNGDGSFSTPQPFASEGHPVRALDANGDGKVDLLANGSLFVNEGAGVFAEPVTVSVGAPRIAADLNNDAKIDLVGSGGRVFVSLNRGDGYLGPRTGYETVTPNGVASSVRGPAVGDINQDGWLDIAAANDQAETAGVLLNRGDGTFSLVRSYPAGRWPTAVALGDLNGDGWPELVVANSGLGNSPTDNHHYLAVYRNQGDATFAEAELLLVEWSYGVELADLDRDGKLDIVVGHGGGSLVVVLNRSG